MDVFCDVFVVMLNEECDFGFIFVIFVVYKDQQWDVVVQNGVFVGEVQIIVYEYIIYVVLMVDEIQIQVYVFGFFYFGIGLRVIG